MSTTSKRFESSADMASESDQPTVQVAVVTDERKSGRNPQPSTDTPGSAQADRGIPAAEPRAAQNAPTRWVWNLPLLLATLAVLGVGAPILIGLYYWQSARIGGQLLQLADVAAADGKPKEEIQWMRRYLALQPTDVAAQVRIAVTYDDLVTEWSELDQARRHLSRALAALEGGDAATEEAVRRRLIRRLVQLGGNWLIEAERQILQLNPPAEDPLALAQLAKSVIGQIENQVPRPAPSEPIQREEHYWRWVASQPPGELLRAAYAANPQSVEIAAALLNVYLDRPELFSTDQKAAAPSKQELLEQANQLVGQLAARQDSGRAQWTAMYYASREGITSKPQPVAVVADAALKRLQDQAQTWDREVQTLGPLEVDDPAAYQPFWDVQLVLMHCENLANGQAFDAVKDQCQTLVSLPESMLSSAQLEKSYLGLGQAHWQSDDLPQAREIWLVGNEKLGGASLTLLEPLAVTSSRLSSIEEARADIERLADAVDATALQLASTGARMSPIHRDSLQTQLNRATWHVDVLRANVDFREGDYRRAAQRLERAVASQLDIAKTLRLDASDLLAMVYSRQGLWDLAARVLSSAAVLNPNDPSLRQRAALAWQNASATTRALEQWQRADDGSFMSGLQYALALAADLRTKPPAQRNFKPLVAAIKEAQQRLDQTTAAGLKPSDAWRLTLLKFQLPEDVRSEVQTQASGDLPASEVQQLAALSREYPDAAPLQGMAVLVLQQAGEQAAADEAMQRLLALPDVDPLVVLETKARRAVQRGEIDQAVQLVQTAETADGASKTRFAAEFLRSVGKQREALESLRALPLEQHDVKTLVLWGELLIGERQADAKAEDAGAPSAHTAELQKVEAQLRELEGAEGTHWRLLAAQRLLQFQSTDVRERRRHLTEAAELQREIATRRPTWSHTLALGGQIAAMQGDHRSAVDSLRRAIAEGDKRASTVLLLVQQLNRLGDVAGAEQELARLETFADTVGEVSAMSVGMALGQGKYDAALQRARAGVTARPADPEALLVLSQAAAAVARTDTEQAEALRKEAQQALERANELTGGRVLSIWQAQFRLQSEIGGAAAARQVLEAMQQSELPIKVRALAVASGYMTLKDWELARAWLAQAKQANPTDPAVHLAYAAIYQANQDAEGALQSLEEAHRVAPHRADIRRQLALTLAAEGTSDVPWERIAVLIGGQRDDQDEVDQIYHALILINRGGASQIEQAREMLRRLIADEQHATAADATRLLLNIERKQWEAALAAEDREQAAEKLAECRKLYDRLVRRSDLNPTDLFNYGDLLLKAELDSEANQVADRLASVAPGSRNALELRLRLALRREQEANLKPIIQSWMKSGENTNEADSLAVATEVLYKLNLHHLAVELLAAAYQADPTQLQPYVTSLMAAQNAEQAVSVCLKHFEQNRSPEPVRLMADAIVQTMAMALVTDTIDQVFEAAVTEFPNNLRMLESIGSLRLSQHRYADAISIYKQAEKLNPISLVTLNNMAIALAETPGRQAEGLPRIRRAVELYGRNAELLDSLGVVQLRANLLNEAEATLREAYDSSNSPHHLLHLLFVLHASGKGAELEPLWKKFDRSQINRDMLTASDLKQLEELQKHFGTSGSL